VVEVPATGSVWTWEELVPPTSAAALVSVTAALSTATLPSTQGLETFGQRLWREWDGRTPMRLKKQLMHSQQVWRLTARVAGLVITPGYRTTPRSRRHTAGFNNKQQSNNN